MTALRVICDEGGSTDRAGVFAGVKAAGGVEVLEAILKERGFADFVGGLAQEVLLWINKPTEVRFFNR